MDWKKLFNMNFFSWVIKGVLGMATLLLSAILSYSFFLAISPAGMAVFPFAALTLTEGGFLGWILIFSLMKHHQITSVVALLMIVFCFVTTIVVTFAELIQLFQDHTLVSNDTVRNGTLILLEIMLGLHILAVASDFLIIKIEWLIKEYIPQADTVPPTSVVESHSPTETPVARQLVQPSTSVQPPATSQADIEQMVKSAVTQVLAAQQQSSPLSQPQLDTSASQQGMTNGQNGH
jgi:hypothetical protein